MSIPLSATVTHPLGAFSRIEGGKTQEAMTPYPRPDNAADARGNFLRKITRSALFGVEADARGFVPWKKTRSALLGVEADARGLALRKKTRSALLGVEADARGLVPWKITRSALIGVEADARGLVPWKITRSALIGVEADARGLTPRKITRADPRGGRGRPARQNRAGFSGITGYADCSMLRLVFNGQDIGQEIAFARYAPICLLSKRLPNKPLENNALAPGHGPTRESTPVRRAARAAEEILKRRIETLNFPSLPCPTREARVGEGPLVLSPSKYERGEGPTLSAPRASP